MKYQLEGDRAVMVTIAAMFWSGQAEAAYQFGYYDAAYTAIARLAALVPILREVTGDASGTINDPNYRAGAVMDAFTTSLIEGGQ